MEIPEDVLKFFRKYSRSISNDWSLHNAISHFATWSKMPPERDGEENGRNFWDEVFSMEHEEEMIKAIRSSRVFKDFQSKQKPPKSRSVRLSITKMRKLCS